MSSQTHGRWTSQEDEQLREGIDLYGEKHWRSISGLVPGRTPIQCLHRWTKILKPGIVKGPWSALEDKQLMKWVETEGPVRWSQCAEKVSGRSGKQCRERWFNILDPDIKKGNWTDEEDSMIFQLYQTHGPKWTSIAKSIPGRTENSIKNRFYSTLRKNEQSPAESRKKKRKEDRDDRMVKLINQVQDLESMLSKTRKEIIKLESAIRDDDPDDSDSC